MTAITRLYDSHVHAQQVVRELKVYGIPESEISLISNAAEHDALHDNSNAAAGASVGATIGGGAGLLAGLGLLTIPGVGPVVAAGWLASTLAGAVAGAAGGGVIGALTGNGYSADDAELYAEGLRRGGSLVTVRAPDGRDTQIASVMDNASPVDPNLRRREYRDAGWTDFDPSASPHVMSEAERAERERVRRSSSQY